jgi:hypothetical protein
MEENKKTAPYDFSLIGNTYTVSRGKGTFVLTSIAKAISGTDFLKLAEVGICGYLNFRM